MTSSMSNKYEQVTISYILIVNHFYDVKMSLLPELTTITPKFEYNGKLGCWFEQFYWLFCGMSHVALFASGVLALLSNCLLILGVP